MKKLLTGTAWAVAMILALAALPARCGAKAPKKASPLQAQEFSEAVAEAALAQIRAGFQEHNPELVMSTFERTRLAGWAEMRDRLRDRMAAYDSFRMGYHIVSATAADGQGKLVAEVKLESVSGAGVTPPEHESATLHLTLEHGAQGWRIVDFAPRGFFTQ